MFLFCIYFYTFKTLLLFKLKPLIIPMIYPIKSQEKWNIFAQNWIFKQHQMSCFVQLNVQKLEDFTLQR